MVRSHDLIKAQIVWSSAVALLDIAISNSMRNLNPDLAGAWIVGLTEINAQARDSAQHVEFEARSAMDQIIDEVRRM